MELDQVILQAREKGASDIHISAGLPLVFRRNGRLEEQELSLDIDSVTSMIKNVLSQDQKEALDAGNDLDFAIQSSDGNRQRVNVFYQQEKVAATIRLLNQNIPSLELLGLPEILHTLVKEPRGLILVTGPTGSGKSTTLASMIDAVNTERAEHIITIEDPIEYVYTRKQSLIHQREVGRDVKSFAGALRSALREDPDIILVGEMRDYETIQAAMTAAETGHLVLSTLHTTGAAQTIDRIIDACPVESQNQIRTQMSGVLKGIVTQCLMPNKSLDGRVVATEILLGTDAVCNLIRENKCHQLGTAMQSGSAAGMHTLNSDLSRLLFAGKITKETAFKYSNDKKDLEQYL